MARRNGEAWNDEDIETLVRMFRAGNNNREIARALERTEASVSNRISTQTSPPIGNGQGGRRLMGRIIRWWTDDEIETIRSMHGAGKPQHVIANKVGRSIRSG